MLTSSATKQNNKKLLHSGYKTTSSTIISQQQIQNSKKQRKNSTTTGSTDNSQNEIQVDDDTLMQQSSDAPLSENLDATILLVSHNTTNTNQDQMHQTTIEKGKTTSNNLLTPNAEPTDILTKDRITQLTKIGSKSSLDE